MKLYGNPMVEITARDKKCGDEMGKCRFECDTWCSLLRTQLAIAKKEKFKRQKHSRCPECLATFNPAERKKP